MISTSWIGLVILCFSVSNCSGRRTFTFSWEAPTEPTISLEDDEAGQKPASADMLIRYALTTTREVLDLQTKYVVGVIHEFMKIRNKHNITWTNTFENILLNCQSIIEHDQEEIRMRLVGNELPFDSTTDPDPQNPESISELLATRQDPPDFTTNPFRPASISNLIHNFNHMILILEDDESLQGKIDNEIQAIRRLFDNAEGELHRFNYRIRKIMKRVEKRLSSSPLADNCTKPLFITTPFVP